MVEFDSSGQASIIIYISLSGQIMSDCFCDFSVIQTLEKKPNVLSGFPTAVYMPGTAPPLND
jgi:hypothetical protein